MMKSPALHLTGLAVCLWLPIHGAAAQEMVVAAPYKLMRSLQILQDQIAGGDSAALEMQPELVKLIDKEFRRLSRTEKMGERDARALIAFAMAGGNPATLEELLPNIAMQDDDLARLAVGILVFQKGAAKAAALRLNEVSTRHAGGLLGASLALVRGLVTEDDSQARVDFDTARLLAPGTLVEEAALRRLMTIHKRRQDPVSFLRVSSRYARRYIASPYALQFAQEFVEGVVAMDGWIDRDAVQETIDFMPRRYRQAITIRLMRSATLAGKTELVRHIASQSPEMVTRENTATYNEEAPATRETLYAKISEVTSENIREVLEDLREIDRSELSEGDEKLLQAVLAVADTVTNPEPVDSARFGLPDQKLSVADAVMQEAVPVQASIFSTADPDPEPEPLMEDFDKFVSGTRETLSEIDNTLEEIQ